MEITLLKRKLIISLISLLLCLPVVGIAQDIDELIKQLKDPDLRPEDRKAAASKLGELGDTKAVPALIEVLNVPAIKGEVINSLGKLGDPRAVPHLKTLLIRDTDNFEIFAAADALIMIGGEEAIKALVTALDDPDHPFSGFIVRELQKHVSDESLVGLGKALLSSSWETNKLACEAIREYGAKAIEYLSAALNSYGDDKWRSKIRLSSELADIATPEALAVLDPFIERKDIHVFRGAYRYVIEKGEQGTEEILIQALDSWGSSTMAEVFLNSGNEKLKRYAESWAKARGHKIMQFGPNTGTSIWGSRKGSGLE